MTARRRPRALSLTCPGGPAGWPAGLDGVSYDEALVALGRRKPGPVYVVGIDQADRSGIAVHDLKRIVTRRLAVSTLDKVDALESLRMLPGWDWQRVLVVFEDHSTIPLGNRASYDYQRRQAPTRNTATILGLGAAKGSWSALLDLRNHPKAQRLAVEPKAWRRVLAGLRFSAGDDWKSVALRWAQSTIDPHIDDDNVAEACVIATWGSRDGLYQWATDRLADRARERAKEAP